ncbi:MAG TPA: hypothetical protein VNA20_09770 [Frankiaceae bacterium]|nr:hypothetical protein [Frankiaceae bacterium]
MTDPWAPPAPNNPNDPNDPWAAPPVARDTNRTLLVAGAICAVLALAVVALIGRSVLSELRADEAALLSEQRQEEAASDKVDATLSGPADTETVSPAPDGSRLFKTRSTEPDAHAYRLRLPGPWEGWFVGAREHEDVYIDAIFTRSGAVGMSVEVLRIDGGIRWDPHEFGENLTEAIEDDPPPGTIVAPYAERTVGDGEAAYGIDATYTDEDGTAMRLRVVVFQHGGEEFRIDLDCPADLWETVEPEFERILRSWRWG